MPKIYRRKTKNISKTIITRNTKNIKKVIRNKSIQKNTLLSGFSLIELMIVIAIISILSMIAIPSYQGYIQRARFTEVISATEAFKLAISLALQQGIAINELVTGAHGIPPEPKSTKNLASIKVENGIITATGSELVNQTTFILKPNADGTVWAISGSCLKNGMCHA